MLLSANIRAIKGRTDDEAQIKLFGEGKFEAIDYTFDTLLDGNCPWNREDPEEYAGKLVRLAKKYGLVFNQAHATYVYDWEQPDVIEKVVIPTVSRCIEYCSYMGIPHIIVHGFSHPAVMESEEKQFTANVDYFKTLAKVSKNFGVKIALENIRKVCNTPEKYKKMMDTLNDDCFVACVDIGHSALVGQDAAEIIRTLGHDRVRALHVHDNGLVTDDHMIPGTGKTDWNHMLQALADIRYTGDFTLEVLDTFNGVLGNNHGFDDDFDSVSVNIMYETGNYLRNKLLKMMH